MTGAQAPAGASGPGGEGEAVSTLPLRIAGIRMELRFGPGHEELAAEAERLWRHLREDGPGPVGSDPLRRTYCVPAADGPADAVTIGPGPGAAYALSGDVTRQLIGRLLGSRILLHAGVVRHPRLGVVAVVGASGAGKSTATSALGRGGGYLTDELAIIDPGTLAVTAYPKPVSRVRGGSRRKQDLALEELGLEPLAGVPGIDHLVLLDRDAEASPCLERVGLAQALLDIIAQSSSLWTLPHGLAALARLVTGTGGALRARYAEADQLAGMLADPPAPAAEDWQEIALPSTAGPGPGPGPGPGTVGVAAPVQALAVEDGAVVLAEGRAAHLTGIGALVWEELASSGPRSLAQLEAHVVRIAGAHARSAELVAAAVDALVAEGWAVRG